MGEGALPGPVRAHDGVNLARADLEIEPLEDVHGDVPHVVVLDELTHFDDGGVFVAVGAAHVMGERGLLKQLEQQGFEVSRVAPRP